MKRINISSNTIWEENVAYSRAVRIGNIVEVAGTTAVNEKGEVIGVGDPYAQTKFIFEKMEKALQQAGTSLNDTIRTRIYVSDISHFEAIGKAHYEAFKNVKPACTMLEISALVNPDLLVEIELSAVIQD